MAANKVIMVSEEDSVAVALEDLKAGEVISDYGHQITLIDDIPFGHKVAVKEIEAGENVIKYGFPIGHVTNSLRPGSHVHTHNLKTNLEGVLEYEYHPSGQPESSSRERTFQGYLREDGSVGIRNELWIIPTVGCVNQTAQLLEQEAKQKFGSLVDDIHAYTHNMGCSQLTEDHERTQKILKGLAKHPNAGGVLILSLGCENNNLESFMPVLGEIDSRRVKFLVTQDVEDEYEAGLVMLEELAEYAGRHIRQEVSLSELTIGFKCGGSDAFSGITANALCGKINDRMTAHGASTILTEVPEMFGAETLLMDRAADQTVFEKIVNLINDFKGYFTKYNQTIYENPSPGNKQGGVSTLEEKSLGCVQKGGKATVRDVLDYGERVSQKGLNLLTGPGNDQVSCTNLVASGAQIILFTTGRGNPFGAPVPTVKIASNTKLYEKKPHWIDINAGKVLEGIPFEEYADEVFEYLIQLASGEQSTRNEENNYRDISVFRDGVIL